VSVRHHPADAVLADYAAGTLKPGFDLVVAAHLERCPTCRATVRLFEGAKAGVMQDAEPAAVEADALSRLMARLDEPAPPEPAHDSRPLIQRLPLKRRRWLAPKVWVQPVDIAQASGDKVYLLYVGAGLKGLDHSHSGPEFTQVVSGALNDNGEVFAAGDFCERGPEHTHQPVVEPDDGGCLCLAATEGPLLARDWLGRIIRAAAGV
jgi:putative transcriptional regulator